MPIPSDANSDISAAVPIAIEIYIAKKHSGNELLAEFGYKSKNNKQKNLACVFIRTVIFTIILNVLLTILRTLIVGADLMLI